MPLRHFAPRRGLLQLVCGVLFIALVWGIVLPRLTGWKPVAEWIESNEREGIDPSALYYTDLEGVSFLDYAWTPPREVRERPADH